MPRFFGSSTVYSALFCDEIQAFRCLWWVVVVWGDAGGWVGGMDASCLFTDALQLREPWKVGSVDFRDAGDGGREPRVAIVFGPGARFHCPETGCPETACPVHDTRERVWRHPDFFRYKVFVHAAMPRVTCPVHGARTAPAPWARPGSGTDRRGRNCITVVAGLVEHDVTDVTPGRDPTTVER